MNTKPKLSIGCPVFSRAWCLPLWFDALAAQDFQKDYQVSLCFAWSKDYDGTYDILENRGSKYDEVRIYEFDLPTYEERDMARFTTLAQLRNGLLNMAKETEADYFLSWDNDVLFKPKALRNLWPVESTEAVGAYLDMAGNDSSMSFPSVMHFPQAIGEIAYRRPHDEYNWSSRFECDVIMAVKLMGKEVYQNTRYTWDPVGEDIAWCLDCNSKDYVRYIEPKTRGIHLYDKDATINVLKAFKDIEYPEIYGPLSRWNTPKEEWHL